MVSIVTPVYNTESFLPKFIESVLSQSYKEWELLLIDDGSTDRSLDICNRYAKKDGRINVISQNRGGVANARNIGLLYASGHYLMFADSDDYLPTYALQVTVDIITKERADIVQANWYTDTNGVIKSNRRLIKNKQFNNQQAVTAFLNVRLLGGYIWSKLYRTEILNGIKFPTDMSLGEDSVFAFRAFLNANKVVYISEPIYYYRIRKNSITMRDNTNYCNRNLNVFKQMKYIHDALENNGNIDAYKNAEEVFRFYLAQSSLEKYRRSNNATKVLYREAGEKLKAMCDESWKKVFFMAYNPRVKLHALKYGLITGRQ